MIKKMIISIALCLAIVSNVFAQIYQDENLFIIIDAEDAQSFKIAQSAALTAYDFFNGFGYDSRTLITLKFMLVVMYEWTPDKYERVFAYADQKTENVYATQWSEPWLLESKIFGQQMSLKLYQSILVHEICHLISNAIAGKSLGTAVSEYISYSAQIKSLGSTTINKITERYSNKPIKTRQINSLRLWENAHQFGVQSYLHNEESDGFYIGRILKSQFDPDRQLMANLMGRGR